MNPLSPQFRRAAMVLTLLAAGPSIGFSQSRGDARDHRQHARGDQSRPHQAPQGRGDHGQRPPHSPPQTGSPRGAQPHGGQAHAERRPAPRSPSVHPAPFARTPQRVYPEPRFYDFAPPRVHVPIVPYSSRYYAFRPRYRLGFGVYLGYPVPYPLTFGDPTYVYGDGLITAPIEPLSYGGISLAVTPDSASVIVDGVYVGTAHDFSPTHQPLTLATGRHHIELLAEGLEPLAFDVDVVAGEVLPFEGMLRP